MGSAHANQGPQVRAESFHTRAQDRVQHNRRVLDRKVLKPEGVIGVLQVVTFGVQLGSVLGEALEANLLPQQVQELFEGGTGCLVVVHFLFGALARSAVHHADLHLKTQLGSDKGGERKKSQKISHEMGGAAGGRLAKHDFSKMKYRKHRTL